MRAKEREGAVLVGDVCARRCWCARLLPPAGGVGRKIGDENRGYPPGIPPGTAMRSKVCPAMSVMRMSAWTWIPRTRSERRRRIFVGVLRRLTTGEFGATRPAALAVAE